MNESDCREEGIPVEILRALIAVLIYTSNNLQIFLKQTSRRAARCIKKKGCLKNCAKAPVFFYLQMTRHANIIRLRNPRQAALAVLKHRAAML